MKSLIYYIHTEIHKQTELKDKHICIILLSKENNARSSRLTVRETHW